VRTSLDNGEELDALAKCSPEKQHELIARAANGEKVSAKVEFKKETRTARERVLGGIQCALPTQKFGVIVADPEWRFEPWSRETGMDRAADNWYPTSATEVIAARDVASIAADDCVLFLWATVPMLAEAFCVLDAWGFARFERDPQSGYLCLDKSQGRYVSSGSWTKYKAGAGIGMGHWFRVDHEILLVATRGTVPAPAKGCQARSVFDVPASRVHSQKPELVHEIIEGYFPTLPQIELNRRGPARSGWSAWGLEAQGNACEAPTGAASDPKKISPPVIMAAAPAQRDIGSIVPDIPECLRRGADGLAPWQHVLAAKGAAL
jgi:N6-adenosine-specific RNA methylase IME4